jgi:hypothetical protein
LSLRLSAKKYEKTATAHPLAEGIFDGKMLRNCNAASHPEQPVHGRNGS